MPSKDEEADFAKAYKDLVEAEKTAATLEAQLNSLEQKLDNFLAEHDREDGNGEGGGEGGEGGEEWKECKKEQSSLSVAAPASDKSDTENAGGS